MSLGLKQGPMANDHLIDHKGVCPNDQLVGITNFRRMGEGYGSLLLC